MNLSFFKEILKIKSTIDTPEGVTLVHRKTIEEFDSIETDISFYRSKNEEVTDCLEIAFPGSTNRWITLVTHADTVSYKKKWFEKIDFSNDYIEGQGVADIKSGTLIAIESIKNHLNKVKNRKYGVRLISSSCEEIGSPGFHEIFNKAGQQSDYVFGMEPSSPEGGIFSSRNGNKWIKFTQMGESAHSGRAPKHHKNVTHELVKKLLRLEEFLQDYPNLTMQTGAFRAGRYFNVIPKMATAKVDFRFLNKEALSIIDDSVDKFIDCKKEVFDFCPALVANESSKLLGDKYQGIVKKIENRNIDILHSGGAGDVNHFCTGENIILDGLGAVGGNLHREDEYIEVKYLETRIKSLTQLLEKVEKCN